MRLKFRKYQYGGTVGGGFYQVPFPYQMPDTYTGAASILAKPEDMFLPRKPEIDKEKFKPDLSEFFKELKGKGHTNEVNQIQQLKNTLDLELSNLSDLDILSGTEKFRKIVNGYNNLTSPALINQLINSKARTDEAFKIATAKKNLSQMHIKDGKVKVLKEGKVIELSPIEAIQLHREGKIEIPTKAKLWEQRDTNPYLSHDYNMSQELTYGLNIDDVIDKWRKNFSSLGNTEYGSRFKAAIDIVSKEIANGNTLFAQDIVNESKGGNNYSQVKAALDMSMAAMSQEEIDTLYSFAFGRILSLGLEPTRKNIETQMYSALINLAESKKDYSQWSAKEYSDVDMTGIGKSLGLGNEKKERIGFFQKALEGDGNKKLIKIGEGQYEITIPGVDLGDIINIDGKGAQFRLLSENPILNQPGAPMIASNKGITFTNREVNADEVVPIGRPAVVLVAVDKETRKVLGTQETLEKTTGFDPNKHEIVRMIAVKVAGVNKDKAGWFTGGELDEEKTNGYVSSLEKDPRKDLIVSALNMKGKEEGEKEVKEKRKIYDNTFDELVSYVALFPASTSSVARDKDKTNTNIPSEWADLENVANNTLNYNKTETKVETIIPVE